MRRLFSIVTIAGASAIVAGAASTAAAAPGDAVQIWVSYKAGHKSAVRQAVLAAGGTIVYDSAKGDALAVRVPENKVDALGARGDVAFVEEDVLRSIKGEQIPPGVRAVQARKVWDADGNGDFDPGAPLGAGRIVCIVDTGYAMGHPDLAGIHVIGGKSFVDDGPWYEDAFGHGTHIAGTIAAQMNGVGAVGIAPRASLYIVRAARNDGTLLSSTVMASVEHCRSIGAHIINLSLGGSTATKTEDRVFTRLENEGVLLVAAAGNDGSYQYHFPASYDSVISVAAVDQDDERAAFSQANPEVELAAPGVEIYSAFPRKQRFTVTAGDKVIQGVAVSGFALGTVTGKLEFGANCLRPGNWAGAIVVCWSSGDTGTNDFLFNNMIAAGAAGLIMMPDWTLSFPHYSDVTYPIVTVPVLDEGTRWLVHNSIGRTVTMKAQDDPTFDYLEWSGTSFATPHVAGVAALIWSKYPDKTNLEVRKALKATARDLGEAGKDPFYGHGLVRAKAALEYLGSH